MTSQKLSQTAKIIGLPLSKSNNFETMDSCIYHLLKEEELKEIDEIYEKFIKGEISVGRDYGDLYYIAIPIDIKIETDLVSIMLPSKYYPGWKQNIYEKRAAHIAKQLEGNDMVFDYDRLLAKRPKKKDAIFDWHQDRKYCQLHGPLIESADPRAVLLSLSLNDTNENNGCLKYVPGSHKGGLRPHFPVTRVEPDEGHEIPMMVAFTSVDEETEKVVSVPTKRGDVVLHGDFTLHCSGGNTTDGWRRNYVLSFRPEALVNEARERRLDRSMNC